MVEAERLRQLHKRQHPDYKYQPRRRRGQSGLGPESPGPASTATGGVTSNNGKEEPLTPPHTPSEESERLRTLGGGHKPSGGEAGAELGASMESYLSRYSQYTQAQAGHTMQEVIIQSESLSFLAPSVVQGVRPFVRSVVRFKLV